jgi:O-antigen/teichoic acid export membrane protein
LTTRRAQVIRGLGWNAGFQIFAAAANFAAMIVLVRLIPAAEYGKVATVVGVLTLINAFNVQVFFSHAFQAPERGDPDWSLHWSAGLYIQLAMSGVCHAIAAWCWTSAAYAPIAGLLHLGAVGILLTLPTQLAITMLQRDLNFARLRILMAASTLVRLGATVLLAWYGWGAYAIVVGGNLLSGLPFAIDLLFIRRWRPDPGSWRWPDWRRYAAPMRFGLHQVGSALVASARGVLEAVVLPGTVGYTAIGLWSRGHALYTSTVGQGVNAIFETVRPVLPRSAGDPVRYAANAGMFVRVMLLIMVPGAVYIAVEGITLSRILYGIKWTGADPLILPGALAGLGLGLFLLAATLVLSANRARHYFVLNVLGALICTPALLVPWQGGDIAAYAWALAGAQFCAGLVALRIAAPLIGAGWIVGGAVPAIIASACGAALVELLQHTVHTSGYAMRCTVDTVAYALSLIVILRALFPGPLRELLAQLPGGASVRRWLRLN